MERALRKLGRASYRVDGFIAKPHEAIEKLGPIDDPLIGICVHWFYGPHTTDGVVGKSNPNWWYAFVDLQEKSAQAWDPRVFLVPSLWVGTFVQSRWKRKMFMLPQTMWAETEEQWPRIRQFLDGDAGVRS
jgi:hypothetical protein